jgi:hypothetical protein
MFDRRTAMTLYEKTMLMGVATMIRLLVSLVRRAPGPRITDDEQYSLLVAKEIADVAETGTDKHGST